MGTFCPAECYPDGKTSALSLPVKWALNTQAAYKDPSRDEYVTNHIVGMYRELEDIASGQYAADFAPSQRIAKVSWEAILLPSVEILLTGNRSCPTMCSESG